MNAHQFVRLVVVSVLLFFFPATAWPQAETGTIAGIVRDPSGGVMPGVTVEAASPALIERVRSVTTDNQGLYRIVELRPGVYTVTFTVPGFSTLRREGIELTTGFTATVNAELKVGTVEETVTVSGASPVVDVQNVQQQTTFRRDTLDALPTTRRPAQLVTLIPGANAGGTNFHDVGGVGSDRGFFGVHGQRPDDMTYNFAGMDNRVFSGGGFQYNAHTFQELVVETAAGSAEATTGGVQINIIPKDGGNRYSGSFGTENTGPGLQSENLTDDLRARGLNGAPSVRGYYDFGGGLGGPVKRDKLWFFGAYRSLDKSLYQAGNYYNKRQGTLFYEPDSSQLAYNRDFSDDYSLRLTWQAAAKHKIVLSHDQHPSCQCMFAILEQVTTISAPEAVAEHHYDPQFLSIATYTYPVTSRLLLEVNGSMSGYHRNQKRIPGVGLDDIAILDTGLNLRYGSRYITGPGYQVLTDERFHERFGASYVTGSHNLKIGLDLNQFSQGRKEYTDVNLVNQAKSYTFRNQAPVSVTIYATPTGPYNEATENSVYAQDQWRIRNLTLNLGLRYTVFDAFIPESHLPAGPYVPARDYPAVAGSPHWQNLSPRLGAAYDLFGTGRTALKVALGRYPVRNTGIAVDIPALNQAISTTRSWSDVNGNYVPDCDLRNPSTNGECGGWNDLTFGRVSSGNTRRADDAREGLNLQNYNWQGSVSVQHELRPNIGVSVGYFRTWYGGFLAVDNQLVTPADFDPYCITAPVDPRLPGGGGNRLCGIYDIRPEKFGQVDNLITQSSHYGKQSEVFDGIDVTLTARFGRGGQAQGGLSTGRTVTDNCLLVDSPSTVVAGTPAGAMLTVPTQDARPGFCRISQPWAAATQVKFAVVYPLPWHLQTSALYQNAPGFPIAASYVATNAEIKTSLGRNLAACPSQTAATCNQTVTIDLIPLNTMFDDRIQQLDLRFSRIFTMGRTKLQGNVDIYNTFNASTILNENTRYTNQNNQWLNAVQIMGGRLFKFGVQLSF
jgi:carboxypeptidase family protein